MVKMRLLGIRFGAMAVAALGVSAGTAVTQTIDRWPDWRLRAFLLYVLTISAAVGCGVVTATPQIFTAAIAISVLTIASVSHSGTTLQFVAGITGLVMFAIGSVFVPSANPAVGWITVIAAVAIAQWIAILNDRSDRRVQTEVARLDALAESRQSDLMAIAHDLRNPIAFISGIVELLDRGDLSPDERTATFARMGIVARRMDRTVVNLVDLGAVRDGRLEP